jgi:two-component system sensor histidine kinase AgrC
VIINFIAALFINIIEVYLWNRWSEERVKLFSFKNIIILFMSTCLILFNYFNFTGIFKVINITIMFVFEYKILFKTSLKQSIIYPLMSQVLYFVSETIFASIMILILKNGVNEFISNYFGAFITNFSISLIVLLISHLKFVSNGVKWLYNKIIRMDELSVIFVSISILYVYCIFVFNVYYSKNPGLMILLSSIISFITLALLYLFVIIRYDYYRISEKYNNSLNSLKELENVITENRIESHENKNHLMTIRNMTTSKKIIKFIDSILNNNINDSSKIMKETSSIPSGGLRGLVYSKLLIMSNKNIEYELDIAPSVRVVDMVDYGDDTILDICKIIGIFLDNAIEEVETIDDKYIIVEMYKESDVFTISVTNTYNNTIDKKDIYKPGYSTKGDNHGYGLPLVKKLVKNNTKLKTHHEITEDEFTQVLEVYK